MTEETLAGIDKALAHGGYTHTVGDVVRDILAGEAQIWESEGALIVTRVQDFPRRKLLHFWLATGELDALTQLSHRVLAWGKQVGCDGATLSGRRGWERALSAEGWRHTLTVLEREI